MAEKAFNRDKVCEELEKWFDLVTKRHDEVIQKAGKYVGFDEQVRSVRFIALGRSGFLEMFGKTSKLTSVWVLRSEQNSLN